MRPHTYYQKVDDMELPFNEFAEAVFEFKKKELQKERRKKKRKR